MLNERRACPWSDLSAAEGIGRMAGELQVTVEPWGPSQEALDAAARWSSTVYSAVAA
jgi:hypothetical protein